MAIWAIWAWTAWDPEIGLLEAFWRPFWAQFCGRDSGFGLQNGPPNRAFWGLYGAYLGSWEALRRPRYPKIALFGVILGPFWGSGQTGRS